MEKFETKCCQVPTFKGNRDFSRWDPAHGEQYTADPGKRRNAQEPATGSEANRVAETGPARSAGRTIVRQVAAFARSSGELDPRISPLAVVEEIAIHH